MVHGRGPGSEGRDAPARLLACERPGEPVDAGAQLSFLNGLSAALASSLDPDATLREVTALMVPVLADWCAVHIVDDGAAAGVRRVAITHHDPVKQPLAEHLLRPSLNEPAPTHWVAQALRTGQPALVVEAVDGDFDDPGLGEAGSVYRALGARSGVAVPLVARGYPVGVLTLALGESGRAYGHDDLPLVNEVAARAAVAVDNARLFAEAGSSLRAADRALALLDSLFSNAPVALAFFDTDRRYVKVNDLLAGLNGMPAEAHLGRTIAEVVPDVAPQADALLRSVLDTGEAVTGVEVSWPDPRTPGTTNEWVLGVYPVRDRDGALLGAGAVLFDVSAQKQSERELRCRADQQAAVAELGRQALLGAPVRALMEEAARAAAANLQLPYAAVLEHVADDRLLVRAVVGWPSDVVGQPLPTEGMPLVLLTLASKGPVVVDDLAREDRFTPPPSLVALGVRSAMAMVIRDEDAVFGVITVHATQQRRFGPDDVVFLRSVANVVAAAMSTREAEQELRSERTRLRLALDAGRMGDWEWDMASDRVSWSESLERIFGLAPGSFPGTFDAYVELILPEDRQRTLDAITAAVADPDGPPYYIEHRVVFADGTLHWINSSGRVVLDDDGRPAGMIGVASDITDRIEAEQIRSALFAAEKRARAEAEAAREQLEFLAEASAILGSSLDYHQTLARVARLVVPRLADWCSVHVVEEDRKPIQVTVHHSDPSKVALAAELQRRYPPDPDAPVGVAAVIRSGQPEVYPLIPDELLAVSARDADHLAILRELGFRSAMLVPLSARNRTFGAIAFVSAESQRVYGEADLAFAEDLARRAAAAIDNSRLYQDASDAARALQQSLLPPQEPSIPGLEVGAAFRPLSETTQIGGDFWDAFEAADGSWCVAMGDVCGKGPAAAAVTGLARSTIRAVALHNPAPARVLELLNEAVGSGGDDAPFLTVVFARLEPGAAGTRMTLACGGHPLPLVRRASGAVEEVGVPGSLIGVFADAPLSEAVVTLHPGDRVVLYTDGVTEARRDGELFGEERLAGVVAGFEGGTAKDLAAAVEAAVLAWQPDHREDDLAVLVVEHPAPATVTR